MKTTITKKLIGLALSVLSLTAAGQCPSITNLNVVLGVNGTASITPVISGTVSPTMTMYYWQISPSGNVNSNTFQSQGEFQFYSNGTYNVCLIFSDSLNGCMSNQYCAPVTITNLPAASCNADFTAYTDSNCVTYFTNTSTGSNMTYGWTINGINYSSTNPSVNLPNGNYSVLLQTYYAGQPCDSIYHSVNVGCSGTNTVSCVANFTFFTDSACVTHITNTSTGTNLTYQWYDVTNNSNPTLISTIANPVLNLSQGYSAIQMASFSNGTFCDSVNQYIYVSCGGTVTPTSCNIGFTAYSDSNCVTYFVNSTTGSNLTYNWHINGLNYYTRNASVNLPNGSYQVILETFSNGMFCDSAFQTVNVACSGTNTVSCHAGFTFYVDSNTCETHIANQSTGNNLTYQWYDMTNDSLLSTVENPILNLANGYPRIGLYTFSNGTFCDSISQNLNISCSPSLCQANPQFNIYADSLNAGSFYVYDLSSGTGTVSYFWNFGDGSSSTQPYPFHQYAVPGHYVICLTISATSANLNCSNMYCDSSSVQRVAAGFLMSQIQVYPQSVTGIKQSEIVTGLKAFPNPIADALIIEATTTSGDDKLSYVLTDALGRKVINGELNNSKTTINTSTLEKGFYNLSICNEKGISLKTIKLVK